MKEGRRCSRHLGRDCPGVCEDHCESSCSPVARGVPLQSRSTHCSPWKTPCCSTWMWSEGSCYMWEAQKLVIQKELQPEDPWCDGAAHDGLYHLGETSHWSTEAGKKHEEEGTTEIKYYALTPTSPHTLLLELLRVEKVVKEPGVKFNMGQHGKKAVEGRCFLLLLFILFVWFVVVVSSQPYFMFNWQ